MSTKICNKCSIEKEISEFHKQENGAFGVSYCCKECSNQKYLKNRYKILLRQKLDRKNNPKKFSVRNKNYRKSHKEEIIFNSKKYRELNKEEYNQYSRKYYNLNKEEFLDNQREYNKNRRHTDLNYKLICHLRNRVYRALKGSDKSKTTLALLGCSSEELKQHLESQFKEGMTWENYGKFGWTLDHIKPCASFDLSDTKQQEQCFHYLNLQPLWWYDNLKKSDKYIIQNTENK